MKVCVSVKGRFHAFQLAYALQKNAMLARLITTYPYSHAKRYHLDKSLVTSLFAHEIINQAWGRFAPSFLKKKFDPSPLLSTLYDKHAALLIPDNIDLLTAWSSNALSTLQKAKQKKIKTVLERGSAHILTTKAIYEEEYELLGMPKPKIVSPIIVERELAEYELADVISIPSTFVKKTFIQQGIAEDKLLQIPYGVDLAHFFPSPKQDQVFRVIYCGAITIRKGIHYLLQAFSKLNLPNSELCLVGHIDNDITSILKQYSQPNIKLIPSQPELILQTFYAQASLFCQPSIQDGFSLVIPQAMACGLPVICTENTGGSDLIDQGKNGFIVQARHIEQLQEKILYFYNHPEERKQMGMAAQEKISTGYTWDNYGERIIQAYKNLLAK